MGDTRRRLKSLEMQKWQKQKHTLGHLPAPQWEGSWSLPHAESWTSVSVLQKAGRRLSPGGHWQHSALITKEDTLFSPARIPIILGDIFAVRKSQGLLQGRWLNPRRKRSPSYLIVLGIPKAVGLHTQCEAHIPIMNHSHVSQPFCWQQDEQKPG